MNINVNTPVMNSSILLASSATNFNCENQLHHFYNTKDRKIQKWLIYSKSLSILIIFLRLKQGALFEYNDSLTDPSVLLEFRLLFAFEFISSIE
ncbi:hypothetical protein BpHYR1_048702 [Brachionus plicatilis]|uniref:Uncharacterized protein n=1 Tax=Brachionus plicatilis TaxID=10195 RepID=A0A3M7S4P4_BRAPC|nr:hypothetical protein BpHYR1_048702 [Brachionus plicatilis]